MNTMFKEKIKNRFGEEILSEYDILGEYENASKKLLFRHNICDSEFQMKPNDFLNGHRCPSCANKKRAKKSTITIESYKSKVKEIFNDEYEILSTEITKLSDKIEIKHNCGNTYTATARNLLRGMGCRICSYKKTGEKQKGKPKLHPNIKTTEQFKEDVFKALGEDYSVIGEYINSYTHIKMKHKCGHEYDVLPHNIISHKTKCPKCTIGSTSEKERELLEFIKSIYKEEIQTNNRFKNDDKTFELDIYIPKKKIGIEFNGLYWHSDIKVDKNYHINKTNFFNKLGIRVVQIFEDEWDFKKDIVKIKLKNILGVSDNKRIYARDTKIGDVSKKDKDNFLEKYHIQGKDVSCYYKGLYYEKELIAVMSFSKPRICLTGKKENYDYELSRYATSCNIVGGFSKLLKHCVIEFKIERIQTFADLRWSSEINNVYIRNGFELDHKSSPSYWYIPKNIGIREHRFKYRKSQLKKINGFDETKTEIENMKNFGYKVIYDCGNLCYKMTIKKEIS